MDLVTHNLAGLLLGRALCPRSGPAPFRRRWYLAAMLAASAPDLDYLLFTWDPLRFLADWHRGCSHSLLLLPLWCLCLLVLCRPWCPGPVWRLYGLLCLAMLSHLMLDCLTPFGTQLLSPLSERRFSLNLLFVVDPWLSLTLLWGLWRWPAGAGRALAPLLGYLLLVVGLRQLALSRADPATLAYPQPLAPLYWQLVRPTGSGYRSAFVRLWPLDLELGYQGGTPVRWQWHVPARLPDDWPALRRFLRHPVLWERDPLPDPACEGFTDLRYRVPWYRPHFVFAWCPGTATGVLYRRHYFSGRWQRLAGSD